MLGAVLKCALLKIAHDKYRAQKRQHHAVTDITEVFHSARQSNGEIASLVNTYSEILNPVRVLELFERIPTEVCLDKTSSIFHEAMDFVFVGSPVTSHR